MAALRDSAMSCSMLPLVSNSRPRRRGTVGRVAPDEELEHAGACRPRRARSRPAARSADQRALLVDDGHAEVDQLDAGCGYDGLRMGRPSTSARAAQSTRRRQSCLTVGSAGRSPVEDNPRSTPHSRPLPRRLDSAGPPRATEAVVPRRRGVARGIIVVCVESGRDAVDGTAPYEVSGRLPGRARHPHAGRGARPRLRRRFHRREQTARPPAARRGPQRVGR